MPFLLADEWIHQPTFDVASVKLFRVVLLPEDGLPTRPIKGSRGISSELIMLGNIKLRNFSRLARGNVKHSDWPARQG